MLQKYRFSVPFVNINGSSFHFSDRALGQASACSCGSGWKPVKKLQPPCEQKYFSTPVKQVPNEAQKWSQQKERFLLSVSVFNSKVAVLQSRFNKKVELIPAVHRWLFTCSVTDPWVAPRWAVSADQSCSKDFSSLGECNWEAAVWSSDCWAVPSHTYAAVTASTSWREQPHFTSLPVGGAFLSPPLYSIPAFCKLAFWTGPHKSHCWQREGKRKSQPGRRRRIKSGWLPFCPDCH